MRPTPQKLDRRNEARFLGGLCSVLALSFVLAWLLAMVTAGTAKAQLPEASASQYIGAEKPEGLYTLKRETWISWRGTWYPAEAIEISRVEGQVFRVHYLAGRAKGVGVVKVDGVLVQFFGDKGDTLTQLYEWHGRRVPH